MIISEPVPLNGRDRASIDVEARAAGTRLASAAVRVRCETTDDGVL